jgi:hypothetical protein
MIVALPNTPKTNGRPLPNSFAACWIAPGRAKKPCPFHNARAVASKPDPPVRRQRPEMLFVISMPTAGMQIRPPKSFWTIASCGTA